jgi:chaperonin GroES
MPKLADIIRPMPGKIAVLVDLKEEITPQGLFIPEAIVRTIHDAKPTQGTIVAIGTEDDEEPDIAVSVGDRVVFGKYSGTEIRLRSKPGQDPERIIILTFKDILAKFALAESSDDVTVKG